jgi:hypothetical protein
MKTKAYFIPHCDDEMCDLGIFQYICPHCNKNISDYEVWWEQDNILFGTNYVFKCEHCEKSLTVEWDIEKCQYLVY